MGYLTEAGVALAFRGGLISSPDNRFSPGLSIYGERTAEVAFGLARENYFWGGIALKASAYNAFLEKQSRDSEHAIERDNLNVALAEAWLGYTHSFSHEYELSYVLRVQSSEIKRRHRWKRARHEQGLGICRLPGPHGRSVLVPYPGFSTLQWSAE